MAVVCILMSQWIIYFVNIIMQLSIAFGYNNSTQWIFIKVDLQHNEFLSRLTYNTAEVLVILFRFFGLLVHQRLLSYVAIQSFDFDSTRWTLLQKCVVRIKLDIYDLFYSWTLYYDEYYLKSILYICNSVVEFDFADQWKTRKSKCAFESYCSKTKLLTLL